MKTKIIRILLELIIIGIFVYFLENENMSLIVMIIVIAIWLELYLSMGKIELFSKKSVHSCPCCQCKLSTIDLLKYSFKSIFKNEDFFDCPKCNRLIANLKYHKKKIFILNTFLFGIIEIFLITFSYYTIAIITVFIWSVFYVYGLTFVELKCFKNEEDANKHDIAKHELKQEKNLNTLLGILLFLFFIFALILKIFVL